MKTRIFLTMALLGTTLSLGAQDMYDAQRFSATHYYGSARTIGMGNAVTAVGGDIGSITFNPAGSSVAGYSQISLTFGPSISSNSATGSIITQGATTPEGYGDDNVTRHTRMQLPSFGAVLNVDTHRSRGLLNYSFGVAGNASNNFLSEVFASGVNSQTTYLGWLATQADGIQSADLNTSAAYNSYPWLPVTAYQAGLISNYTIDGVLQTDKYAGATEYIDENGNIGLAGDIDQRYGQLVYGNKYDFVFNWSGNINNTVYIGANIGMTSLDYKYDDYIREQALKNADFPNNFDDDVVRYFDNAKARYSFTASGAGIYAQLGVLARLPGGFRIGAMIQTPTMLAIREKWSQDMTLTYLGETSISAESPKGSGSYRLRTPWKLSAGLAWTLGEKLLLSADYEMMDYRAMKFNSAYNYSDDFSDANWAISQWMGISHTLRVGAEFKPIPQLAIRAGYNLITDPEKDNEARYIYNNRQSISAGVGYSSNGSFFCDLAVRMLSRGKQFITPYGDYIENIPSPEIAVSRNHLWDVMFTAGWRF